jgi:hypothetical protein
MIIEFYVEELSMEYFLNNLIPKIIRADIPFKIHNYGGKENLLKRLPIELPVICDRIQYENDLRICIIIDKDEDQNCQVLKGNLENIVLKAGLNTKSAPAYDGSFHVLNRIAIEELEAWYFGNIPALHEAFPRVEITLDKKKGYRDPDAIKGGAWENLIRLLSNKGYKTGLTKTKLAEKLSVRMDPSRNRSRSFQVFRDGLISLVNQ